MDYGYRPGKLGLPVRAAAGRKVLPAAGRQAATSAGLSPGTMPAAGAIGRSGMWELRQDAGNSGKLHLYVYGYVEPPEFNFSTGEMIGENNADFFRQTLESFPDVREIDVYINSLGGDVIEGTAIYNQLKRHPARVTVFVDGFAASIASVIAMAGDEIVMPPNALMMIHNMSMGVFGTPQQLRKAAEDLSVMNEAGKEAYLQKAGDRLDRDRLSRMMDRETWLPARECLELGLCDRISETVTAEESEDLPGQRSALLLAARALGVDSLASRVREAEERAARAEAILSQDIPAEDVKEAAKPHDEADEPAQKPPAEKAEAAPAMSIMEALCGL